MNGGTWTGSALSHPNAEKLGVFKGLLSEQDMALRDGIGAMRMGIKRHDLGYAPIPDRIDLGLGDGWFNIFSGMLVIEGTSINPRSGDVHFTMTYRENGRLHVVIVDIVNDTITATVNRNPVDEQLTG